MRTCARTFLSPSDPFPTFPPCSFLCRATDDDAASPDAVALADELSPSEVFALMGGADAPTLLDLRTHEQHGSARPDVPLVSMPAGDPGTLGLLFRFSEAFVEDVGTRYEADTPLILMCSVGVVSRVAAARLLDAGHTSVKLVRGGFEAWLLDGALPTLGGASSEAGWVGAPPAVADADDTAFEELEAWPSNADGTPSPIQPRPYGVLEADGEDLATEEEEELAMNEAEETAGAPAVAGAEMAAEGAAAEGGVEMDEGVEDAMEEIDASALEGDELDADLASMVAELDAPVRAPGQSLAALSRDSGGSTGKGHYRTSPVGSGERKRRGRTASDPAWLVDVSNVDFHALVREDRLKKMSVKELKSYLHGKGELLGGNKATLVLRVAECVAAEGGPSGGGGEGGGLQQQQQQQAGQSPLANGMKGTAVGGAKAGAAASGEEDDLARLDTLPPPSEGDEVPLELFNPDGSSADAAADADDFLIDEVFSSM